MTLSSLRKWFVEDIVCQAFENGGTGSTVPREFPLDLLLPLAALLTLDQRHASGFLLKDFTIALLGRCRRINALRPNILQVVFLQTRLSHRLAFPASGQQKL
jgi:hypothetical protein